MSKHLYRALALCSFVASLVFAAPRPGVAQLQAPLTLLHTTQLPGIEGDFDHLAYDLKRNRLIVAAEEHHTLELFDLKNGAHLQTVRGFKAPHSIAYVPDNDEIFITDGDDGSCVILAGPDLHRITRIALRPGPDSALYDAATKRYYIANGGRDEKSKTSAITILSVTDHRRIADVAIDGDNVEAMAVDHASHRLFANIRDKKQIGVIDLATNKVVTTWTAPGINRNTPMKFDEAGHRLFVADRTPGKFMVFDTANGALIASTDCVDSADDLMWDPALRRIYITGSQGISVFHQDTKDSYSQLAELHTIGGKTSLYVPELQQFYVIHPKTPSGNASLLVYRVNP